MDAVLDPEAGIHASLTDEHGRIQPAVARITGLEPRRGPEVLIGELRRARGSDGVLHLLVHLQHAVVLGVDERSVVGLDLGADIETAEPVRTDEEPVATASLQLTADA